MLIDGVAWQASLQGVDRREMIRKWKTRVSFEAFSLTDDSGGINHKWFVWEKNVLTGKKGGGPRFGNVFLRLTNRMAPGLHIVPVTDEVNQFLVQRKTKSITSPQKKSSPQKTPVKEIPPQKEYDGLSADWDASSPHINPPFSEPSLFLSAQFQQMAMTTDARAFPSGRAVLSWLSDDSDVEVSSGDEVD